MRTGGSELGKKTAGKQTDHSNCVVNSLRFGEHEKGKLKKEGKKQR